MGAVGLGLALRAAALDGLGPLRPVRFLPPCSDYTAHHRSGWCSLQLHAVRANRLVCLSLRISRGGRVAGLLARLERARGGRNGRTSPELSGGRLYLWARAACQARDRGRRGRCSCDGARDSLPHVVSYVGRYPQEAALTVFPISAAFVLGYADRRACKLESIAPPSNPHEDDPRFSRGRNWELPRSIAGGAILAAGLFLCHYRIASCSCS